MSEINPTEVAAPTQPVRQFTYKGRTLESLTPDELLTACRWAFREIENLRQQDAEAREMERLLWDTRRILRGGRI